MELKEDVEQGPDGSAQIFIQPLLGCYSRAPSLRAAQRKARLKVLEYADWLGSYGEDVKVKPIMLRLCEVVKGDWPVNLGDSVALFKCDKGLLTREDVDRYLRWMRYSWEDFQRLVKNVPREALDWKPSPDTIRSIRRIIVHIALVQVWYLMKLRREGDSSFRYPKGLSLWTYAKRVDRKGDISLATLNGLRNAVCHRLSNLGDHELVRVTYHRPGGWTGRTALESWTTRKVFRRFLWHERLHMNTMRKLLEVFRVQ